MSLGQIIRNKREKLGFTLDEVAAATSFSKPYLSTIETGRVKPPGDELLKKLESVLKFESGLLRHIAHIERMPVDIRQDYETKEAQNQRLRAIIRDIVQRKTDPSELDDIVKRDRLDIGTDSTTIKSSQVVPVINNVAAGYPVDFDDMGYPAGFADDYVRCPDLHDPNAFAVRVIGDSMEPKFQQGDIVIFSPAVEISNGDDCFVRFTLPHETTFKQVFFEPDDKVRLQPRNHKHPPLIIEGKRINGLYRAVIKYEKL